MQTLFPNNRPDLITASILVSNTYGSVGEYAQSADVRDHRVKTYGGKGEPGVTWTLVNGQITVSLFTHHHFVVVNECCADVLQGLQST